MTQDPIIMFLSEKKVIGKVVYLKCTETDSEIVLDIRNKTLLCDVNYMVMMIAVECRAPTYYSCYTVSSDS